MANLRRYGGLGLGLEVNIDGDNQGNLNNPKNVENQRNSNDGGNLNNQ